MHHKKRGFVVLTFLIACISAISASSQTKILFKAEQPGKSITAASLASWPDKKTVIKKQVGNFNFEITLEPQNGYLYYKIKAGSKSKDSLFLALEFNYDKGTALNFNGTVAKEEIYRQSVHDPGNYFFDSLPRQAVPMMALNKGKGWDIAFSDAPAFYNNYTTQYFKPQEKKMQIASGDNGLKPGTQVGDTIIVRPFYHQVSPGRDHEFNGVIMHSNARNIGAMRQDVFRAIARRWGNINSKFGATAFATNYMLYRTNELKASKYWVVAGIDYCNKQYSRDAFWQSMVLPPAMEEQCYLNEARQQTPGAERPIFALIWAYRTSKSGGKPDMEGAAKSLAYIEKHIVNNRYLAFDEQSGRKNFKSWFDLCMFTDDDVVTYNQGLLVVALHAAQELGLKPSVTWQDAAKAYRGLFYNEGGYFPLSEQKKDLVAVDAMIGDLLHILIFNTPLLEREQVRLHFQKVSAVAKTENGFKIVCMPDGSYAPNEKFDIPGYKSPHWNVPFGEYANGGSYYLYDMLFLITAYAHGIPGADKLLIWRGKMDFEREGTYYEHINTATGKPGKINQGWNGAIYAIMHQLETQGKAKDILTPVIEKIQ